MAIFHFTSTVTVSSIHSFQISVWDVLHWNWFGKISCFWIENRLNCLWCDLWTRYSINFSDGFVSFGSEFCELGTKIIHLFWLFLFLLLFFYFINSFKIVFRPFFFLTSSSFEILPIRIKYSNWFGWKLFHPLTAS